MARWRAAFLLFGLIGVLFWGVGMLPAVEHWLVVKKDGTVWAWGKNDHGQLGDGTTSDRSEAAQVMLGGKIPLIYSAHP